MIESYINESYDESLKLSNFDFQERILKPGGQLLSQMISGPMFVRWCPVANTSPAPLFSSEVVAVAIVARGIQFTGEERTTLFQNVSKKALPQKKSMGWSRFITVYHLSQ
jgi:hypothetical protein